MNHLETALMYQLPHDGYTCKKFTEGLWRMVEEGADHPVKADLADDNTTLVFNGYFTFVQPVNTAYSQGKLLHALNSTGMKTPESTCTLYTCRLCLPKSQFVCTLPEHTCSPEMSLRQ